MTDNRKNENDANGHGRDVSSIYEPEHVPGIDNSEWMLIDHQWEDRQNKKINSLIHKTQNVSVQDIDYTSNRKLDKTQYERMLSLQFINNKENIIIIGAGIGTLHKQ